MDAASQDALWLRHSHHHISVALNCLNDDCLCGIYQHVFSKPSLREYRELHVRSVANEFLLVADFLEETTTAAIIETARVIGMPVAPCDNKPRHVVQAMVVEHVFGLTALKAFTSMGFVPLIDGHSLSSGDIPTDLDLQNTLKFMDKDRMRHLLKSLHPSRGIGNLADLNRCHDSTILTLFARHFTTRMFETSRGGIEGLIYSYTCLLPTDDIPPTFMTSVSSFRRAILSVEFSSAAVSAVFGDDAHSTICDQPNRDHYEWPQEITRELEISCMRNYWKALKYVSPLECAVCLRCREGAKLSQFSVNPATMKPLNLSLLAVRDPFIIQSVLRRCSPEFVYGHDLLDGLFLSQGGICDDGNGGHLMRVCSDCESSLLSCKMPRLAIANNLYRGRLPDEFKDLTWVEERACAIFSPTAFVTRLFTTSDEKNPRVFYGNTCAHEMNVSSTMSVLPRTPSDVRDMLAVVFIGSSPFRSACLKTVYRVRKRKITRFLHWLKEHNRLYQNIEVDDSVADLYPDDDCLPGMASRSVDAGAGADASFFRRGCWPE